MAAKGAPTGIWGMGVMVGLFPLHYLGDRAVVMTRYGQIDGIFLTGGDFQFSPHRKKGEIQGRISIAMMERIS
jgi:hypothetical protein